MSPAADASGGPLADVAREAYVYGHPSVDRYRTLREFALGPSSTDAHGTAPHGPTGGDSR